MFLSMGKKLSVGFPVSMYSLFFVSLAGKKNSSILSRIL